MKYLLYISAILFFAGTCAGKIIYVDSNAPGSNDGSSWLNAYNFLQDGLADANCCDKPVEIRVGQGIYTPDSSSVHPGGTGDRWASFQLINGVTIKGGFAGYNAPEPNVRDFELYETILSGDIDRNDVVVNDPYDLLDEPTRLTNSLNVAYAFDVNESAVLDGFIITGGYDDYQNFGTLPEAPVQAAGAGLLITAVGKEWVGVVIESSPAIKNCTFTYNATVAYYESGGGIASDECSPTIINCNFEGNYSDLQRGGGCHNVWGSIEIRDCEFTNNCGGGLSNDNSWPIGHEEPYLEINIENCKFIENKGSGIHDWDLSKTLIHNIKNCTFAKNVSEHGAGGISSFGSKPKITDCRFIGNETSSIHGGGGIMVEGVVFPEIENCIFANNVSNKDGGGICLRTYPLYNKLIIKNSIFWNNSTNEKGGGIFSFYEIESNIDNCVFYNNTADTGDGLFGGNFNVNNSIIWDEVSETEIEGTFNFCDIKGGWSGPGEGNIDSEPLFTDADNGDYHLQSQGGRWEPNCQTWIKDDVTSPCIDAGDWMSPIGLEPFPNGGRVNMGAYGGTVESSKSYFGTEPCETIIAGDINGDCIVNFVDFAIMSMHWLEDARP